MADLRLHPDRLLPAEPEIREIARRLYRAVRDLPIVSPHGHVDPRLLLDDPPFTDPTSLFVQPDHYVTRLLHAGGIDVAEGPGGTDVAAIVAAFREAGTPIAVVASSDEVYAEHAADLARALADAGATRILLAGSPKTAGLGPDAGTALTGYLYSGCDAAALLTDLLDHITGEAA